MNSAFWNVFALVFFAVYFTTCSAFMIGECGRQNEAFRLRNIYFVEECAKYCNRPIQEVTPRCYELVLDECY